MLETFNITSSSGEYWVEIGINLAETASLSEASEFVVIYQTVADLWFSDQTPDLIIVEASEENKTLAGCARIIEMLRLKGASRDSHLYAFGGGIVQDLATFSASAYMRGIRWTYMPTTLLGMVDSCIGGKSSINVGAYKNIAGNFYPPQKIVIDVKFCKTLDIAEKIAGLCEAVKICFAATGDEFEKFLKISSAINAHLSDEEIFEIVQLSLRTKKRFIEEDEFDNGPRLLLNFGHTFGHAIEAATNFSLTHGVAVGIGMLAEIKFAKFTTQDFSVSPRVIKLEAYIKKLLSNIPEMVQSLTILDVDAAMRAFKSDKKHSGKQYVVVVANSVGNLERVHVPIVSDADEFIRQIFEYLKEEFAGEI